MIRFFALLPFSVCFPAMALFGQNATDSRHPFEDKGFWDDVLENPGEYSYVLIIFVVLGYFLWRVQGLGRDD